MFKPGIISLSLLLLVLVSTNKLTAQIVEMPLESRIGEAELVIEGEVLSKESFWNAGKDRIFTVNYVKIFKVFKGEFPDPELMIVTPGGIIGDRAERVSPSVNFEPGGIGIMMLNRSDVFITELDNKDIYELTSSVQGFIKYDKYNGMAYDPFSVYRSIENELYGKIYSITGRNFQEKSIWTSYHLENEKEKRQNSTLASITSFSPSSARAGTGDEITIFGSDFGDTPGEVQFRLSDYWSSSYMTAPEEAILEWSDTEIRVRVPSDAGTGPIRVVTDGGSTATSSSNISIPFNVMNIDTTRIYLVRRNPQGGYTVSFSDNMLSNRPAMNAFLRALETWRCGVYVRFEYDFEEVSASCPASDGTNLVGFTSSNCRLPSGVIGMCHCYFRGCGSPTEWFLNEFDIRFRSVSINWNYGPDQSESFEQDFEFVSLHELGHGVLLGHSKGENDVMGSGSDQDGNDIRDIHPPSDKAGGEWIMDNSTRYVICSRPPMTPLNSSNCDVDLFLSADFTASRRQGCAPLEVSFSNRSDGEPTEFEWDIDNDGIVDYSSEDAEHTFDKPGSYSVKLKVSNILNSDSITKTSYIRVFDNPIAKAGNDKSICRFGSVDIGGSPAAEGGSPGYYYQWVPASGLDDPEAANPEASPTETTDYILIVSDSEGCEGRDTVKVEVFEKPRADAGPDKEVCIGGSLILGDDPAASGGDGDYSYSWSPSDGLDDPESPNPTVTPDESKSYRLTVEDGNGCTDTDLVRITVHPEIIAEAGISHKICIGEKTFLGGDPTASNGSGEYEYEWDNINEGDNKYNSNPEVQPDTTTLFRVNITDTETGCSAWDTVTVFVAPLPVIDAGSDTTICMGSEISLGGDPTIVNQSAGDVIKWEPSAFIDSDDIPNPKAAPENSLTYYLTVTNAAGCVAGDSVRIEVSNPEPEVYALGETEFCEGDSVVCAGNPGFSSYLWSNGVETDTVVIKESGAFSLLVEDEFGCTGESEEIIVEVYENPEAPIIKFEGGILICMAEGIFRYQWFIDGSAIEGAAGQTHRPRKSGVYAVQIFTEHDCTNISGDFEIDLSKVPENMLAEGVFIYPNPFEKFVYVSSAEPQLIRKLILYNQSGIEVFSEDNVFLDTLDNHRLDLGTLVNGIYFYYIEMDSRIKTGTIIKVH